MAKKTFLCNAGVTFFMLELKELQEFFFYKSDINLIHCFN